MVLCMENNIIPSHIELQYSNNVKYLFYRLLWQCNSEIQSTNERYVFCVCKSLHFHKGLITQFVKSDET